MKGTVEALPASKSISNRVLILQALAGGSASLENLSDANDTQLMLKRIRSKEESIDIEDAGTTMRFLTAYFSATQQQKVLTGTQRMKERPIGILVDALRTLGAEITYLEREGYPPLAIHGLKKQLEKSIRIRGDVSSQFISALMMIAPSLPQGLSLELTGKIGSVPYIEMTASLMRLFGIKVSLEGNIISIDHQRYRDAPYTVESDWSAASYWYAFGALSMEADLTLPRISLTSLQGDRAINEIMKSLGVVAVESENTIRLSKSSRVEKIVWDFTHCPDLAQTVAVVCAVKGVEGNFTGLESLRIKETDRIAALQNELRKLGADLIEHSATSWTLKPSSSLPESISINTYKDHRMAMAFAPLSALMEVTIENPGVVKKSYPRFWEDVDRVCKP